MLETNNPKALGPDARVVIVGAGQAGGWAARTLRKEGFPGVITLVGNEAWPPHERPPLSKNVLLGSVTADSTHLFREAEWAELDICLIRGQNAISLDRERRTLVLENGQTLPWDRLILCTGGRSRLLMPIGMKENCEALRTIDDALRIGARLRSARQVLIVGGGWIGLEVAASARQLGVDVTLVEAGTRLCMRSVPENAAKWLAGLHESKGVHVMLETSVSAAQRRPNGSIAVSLSSPRHSDIALEVDLVVAGIGMLPNDELAQAAGLECASGIIVDGSCFTSDPAILAAGDVAVSPNSWLGKTCRLESWQNAQEQGIAAALSAMGREVLHDPIPWFWSDQYGINVQIQGVTTDADQIVTRGSDNPLGDNPRAIHFYLQNGRVRGVIGINAAKDVRASKKLIAQRASPSSAMLADESVSLNKLA